jgi:hypothetical protein
MKTHNDLLNCTSIPEETQICFLDDVFYPGMSNEKIYYINIKPYIYNLKFEEMINRLETSGILGVESTSCRDYILSILKKYSYIYEGKTHAAQNIDQILSKQILNHLHLFFNSFPNHNKNKFTKHKRINSAIKKNKTIKKKQNY